jgi:hypothetical protein
MGILHYVYRQFGQPRGLLGGLAGSIWPIEPSNIERNDWVLSLLKIASTHRESTTLKDLEEADDL